MERFILSVLLTLALCVGCDKPETITLPSENAEEQTLDVKGEYEEEEEIPIFAPIDSWSQS